MALQTIVLIPSDHTGWTALRTALRARRDLRIDEIPRSIEAAAHLRGRAQPPDVFLVAADRADALPLPRLAQQLMSAGPTSKIIVIGPEATLDGDTLVALLNLGVPGYLTWEGLEPLAVLRGIAAVLAGEVVGSPAVLAALRATLERRQGPRVDGLLLTPEERATQRPGARARTVICGQAGATATLWIDNSDVAFSLPLLLEYVGIAVNVVETASDALNAVPRSDFLIIDCATAADAWQRCAAIITQTGVDVYICHPNHEFVADLKRVAQGNVYWLSPASTGLDLVAKLRILLASRPWSTGLPASSLPPSLTAREREVQRLVAQGCTNAEIAARLGITVRTVKNHVANGRHTLGVQTRKDFGAAYQRSPRD